jgi:hypothetical protein
METLTGSTQTGWELSTTNQLRLRFASFAYILVSAVRRIALKGTRLSQSTCGSIPPKLFKIGAQLKTSVRRLLIHFPTACHYQDVFRQALDNIRRYPIRC